MSLLHLLTLLCNLGIILDKNLSFSQRISSYSKSCFLNIRDLPVTKINRLHLVLNSAARAVTRTPKCLHVGPLFPILKYLRWLTINQIIQYKVLGLTNKSKKTGHPSNLRSLLSSAPHRSTRSSSRITLNRPSVTSGLKLSNRSFEWNSLSSHLRHAA